MWPLVGFREMDVVTMATTELLSLSWPRQFDPISGVTVYCHWPAGTPVSVQVRAAIVPEHPDPID